MKKVIFLFAFISCFVLTQAQTYTKISSWYEWHKGRFTESLGLPQDTSSGAEGDFAYKGGTVYVRGLQYWSKVTPVLDTTQLSTRAWLYKVTDSTWQAKNTVLMKYADSSSMLSNYVRTSGYGLIKNGQALRIDTTLMKTTADLYRILDSIHNNAIDFYTVE